MKYEHCRECRDVVIVWAFWVNVAQTTYKGLLGVMSGSAALVADAMHSGADVVASAVTMVSVKVSSRQANDDYPYGYGNIQYISSSIVGMILILGALYLMYESTVKIIAGDTTSPSTVAILGAVISVITNELMYRYQSCVGRENNSPAILANAWDNRSDAISSLAVLIGIIFAVLGFPIADRIAAVGVGILVARIGIELNVEAIKGLMDSSVDVDDVLKPVYEMAKNTSGVVGVRYLRGREIGEEIHLEIGIYVDGEMSVEEGDAIANNLRKQVFDELDHIKDIAISVVPVKLKKRRPWSGKKSVVVALPE